VVILSNGFGQFHLSVLAESLESSGELDAFITGAYIRKGGLLEIILKNGPRRLARLSERHKSLPRVSSGAYLSEFVYQVAVLSRKLGVGFISSGLEAFAMSLYALTSCKVIFRHRKSKVFHYRAGFGGVSASLARRLGMLLICDHSIAHPQLLEGLVDGTGSISTKLNWFWSRILHDINLADLVLVNSDFVADTCLTAGIAIDKIRVAQTPVPDWILEVYDNERAIPGYKRCQDVLFVGTFELRKGADTFVLASQKYTGLRAWKTIGGYSADDSKIKSLRESRSIENLGLMPRLDLLKILARRPIIVFPTRAEGSARVVAEALCAGCFVITTQEAGSIIESGKTGSLVRVNSVESIIDSLVAFDSKTNDEQEQMSVNIEKQAREELSTDRYFRRVRTLYLGSHL